LLRRFRLIKQAVRPKHPIGPGIKLIPIDCEPLASDPDNGQKGPDFLSEHGVTHAEIGRGLADAKDSRQDAVLHRVRRLLVGASGPLDHCR
jgi:hypothetical protein